MSRQKEVTLPPPCHDFDRGIVIHDPETGAILDANKPAEDLYGYSLDDLRTMEVGDLTASSTKFDQAEALRRIQAVAAGDPQQFEWLIERVNGERRWIRVHLNATRIDDHECVVAEIDDITSYRERENRLRLLSRIIRHNLRNRTHVLMGHADRIQQAVEDEALEEVVETIVEVSREVGTLSDSVRELEEIAKSDATERSPNNLRTLGQQAVEKASEEYSEATVTFEAPADVWVVADRGVSYAIEHAIENAIEHNDQETPIVAVTVGEDTESGYGMLRVTDNGPPIPEVEIEVLDEGIEQESTYHGSGVGLWVMQWCINSLGGELVFEENTPRGNEVSMLLPKADTRSDR